MYASKYPLRYRDLAESDRNQVNSWICHNEEESYLSDHSKLSSSECYLSRDSLVASSSTDSVDRLSQTLSLPEESTAAEPTEYDLDSESTAADEERKRAGGSKCSHRQCGSVRKSSSLSDLSRYHRYCHHVEEQQQCRNSKDTLDQRLPVSVLVSSRRLMAKSPLTGLLNATLQQSTVREIHGRFKAEDEDSPEEFIDETGEGGIHCSDHPDSPLHHYAWDDGCLQKKGPSLQKPTEKELLYLRDQSNDVDNYDEEEDYWQRYTQCNDFRFYLHLQYE